MNLSAQNMLLRSSKRSMEHVFPEQTNIALGPTFCRGPPPLPLSQEGGEACQEPGGGQGAGSVTRADSSSVGRAGSPSPDTGSARVTVTGAARRSASPHSRGRGRGPVTAHNGGSRPPPPRQMTPEMSRVHCRRRRRGRRPICPASAEPAASLNRANGEIWNDKCAPRKFRTGAHPRGRPGPLYFQGFCC